MLNLRCFKITAVFVALAFLLISAVWVYAANTYGYNDEVYWDVTVSNAHRSGDYTYSDHQYYIENDREDETVSLIDYEYKHRVMQTFPGENKSDAEEISKKEPPGAVTVNIPAGTSAIDDYTHEVDISGLATGWYYIHAYTRINIADVREDPVPEAHMNTKSTKFYIP